MEGGIGVNGGDPAQGTRGEREREMWPWVRRRGRMLSNFVLALTWKSNFNGIKFKFYHHAHMALMLTSEKKKIKIKIKIKKIKKILYIAS